MRSNVLRGASLGLIAAVMAVATPSRAQDCDGVIWLPLMKDGAPLCHPVGDSIGGANDARDVVGDAQNPAAFIYQDATYMYFRLRVNGDPIQNGQFIPFGWACAVETDGTLNTYEY